MQTLSEQSCRPESGRADRGAVRSRIEGRTVAHAHPGRCGTLEVRLACDDREVGAAQALRFAVFHESQGSDRATSGAGQTDADAHDAHCRHLIVIDHAAPAAAAIVGTYRLIDRSAAQAAGSFYSASEYDLGALIDYRRACGRPANLLELGRSCIAPGYRTSAGILLLWRGIADHLERNTVDFLFGCASFAGTDPRTIASQLAFLHARHGLDASLPVRALPDRHVPMGEQAFTPAEERQILRRLPPLIRAYLQVGARVGDGAVIDHDFRTTDVFMLLAVDAMGLRFQQRFLG